MSNQNVILLLGSNLGNTKKNLQIAIEQIEKNVGDILKKSIILETKPVEFVSSNFFRNIALSIDTKFSPIVLLQLLKKIEKNMGRMHDSSNVGGYSDRIIDIDIVMFDDLVFSSKKLKIPHKKHLCERKFSKILIDEILVKKT